MAQYLKRDSERGCVEDYVEIQALKFDNVRHTALGNMLGDYDNEGNYIISPAIVNELIAMPKYVVEVMDNLEICLSVVKFDKQLSFLVAFEGEKATLSLLEKVSFEANNKLDAGTWSNVNEYVLDLVETIGEVDRQSLYMKWNIQTFPGNLIDIFNCEDDILAKYFNIITRIKYNMEVKTELLEKEDDLEEMEAEYSMDMFTILQGYPELLKLIQTQLKKEMAEKKDFVKLDRPNFAKTFNELLNKAINNNVGSLSEFERANFENDRRNIGIKSNIKKYDIVDVREEKMESLDENKKIVKIPAEGYKFETFEGMATNLAKAEKDATSKSTQNAIDISLGKGKGKKSELYWYLSTIGIKPETIMSKSVLDILKARTLKDLESKAENMVTKASINSTKNTTNKGGENKKDNKKKDDKKKKPEKKAEKKGGKGTGTKTKKEENKEAKSTSSGGGGGYYSTGATTKSENKTESSGVKTRTLEELNNKSLIGQRVGTSKNLEQEAVMEFDKLNQIMAERNNLLAKRSGANVSKNNSRRVREQTAPESSINDTIGV